MEFKLEKDDFIKLNDLLKVTGLCDTGGMANTVISEGRVNVDGHVELRKRRKIRVGHIVEFEGHKITVT